MADIMIDFMGMINVMVDIMATATGTGNGGNNNCNNKLVLLNFKENMENMNFHGKCDVFNVVSLQ